MNYYHSRIKASHPVPKGKKMSQLRTNSYFRDERWIPIIM